MTSQDFIPDDKDKRTASLVNAMMGTEVGKDRKAILNTNQAIALARARAFADIYNLPELHKLCDILQDTTVSIKGVGLQQLVKVLTAKVASGDQDEFNRLRRLTGGL